MSFVSPWCLFCDVFFVMLLQLYSCIATMPLPANFVAESLGDIQPAAVPLGSEILFPVAHWQAIACSSTGQYVVAAANSGLYTSSDFGESWAITDDTQSGFYEWRTITSSENGQYWAAAIDFGQVYTSNNYGVTWSAASLVSKSWQSVASSTSGQYLAAVYNDHVSSGSVYTSSDFGVTWSESSAHEVHWRWNSITSSSTGQFLAAVAWDKGVFISNDYGASWNLTSSNGGVTWAVAGSSSGQFLAAASDGEGLYTSNDYGTSWQWISTSGVKLKSLVASESGQYLLGVDVDNGVHTSSDYGVTWLSYALPYGDEGFTTKVALSRDGHYAYATVEKRIYRLNWLTDNATPLT